MDDKATTHNDKMRFFILALLSIFAIGVCAAPTNTILNNAPINALKIYKSLSVLTYCSYMRLYKILSLFSTFATGYYVNIPNSKTILDFENIKCGLCYAHVIAGAEAVLAQIKKGFEGRNLVLFRCLVLLYNVMRAPNAKGIFRPTSLVPVALQYALLL
jgi:hypothetical protein